MRHRKIYMDDWDKAKAERKYRSKRVPMCDMKEKVALHRIGVSYYISQFRRTSGGTAFDDIKASDENVTIFAESASNLITNLIKDTSRWCIVTTPKRRHFGSRHFATLICQEMSRLTGMTFYDNAVQALNKDRLSPEFMLLRPIVEPNVIIYDDIITTGKTIEATRDLFDDKQTLTIIGINNR